MAEDEFINMNLDDVPDDFPVLPETQMRFRVVGAERKQKEGSAYPYVNLQVSPLDCPDPLAAKSKPFIVLTFNPKGLFMMKAMRKGCSLPTNIPAKALLDDPSSDQQYVGCEFICKPSIRMYQDKKQNEFKPPFISVR